MRISDWSAGWCSSDLLGPVLGDVLLYGLGRGLEEAQLGHVLEQTRLREDREVGSVSPLGAEGDLSLELLRRFVLAVDAVLFFPVGPRLLEQLGLGVADRVVDRDGAALSHASARPTARHVEQGCVSRFIYL